MKTTLIFMTLVICSTVSAQKAHKVNIVHLEQYKEDADQSIYFADYDASRRGSIILHTKNDLKSPVKILSEPPPDAIVAYTTAITNSLKVQDKLTAEQSLQFSQTVSKLTEKNTTIVVLRDALYRLNEYDFNRSMTAERYDSAFNKILNMVKQIHQIEIIQAKKEVAKQETEKIQAITDQIIIQKNFADNENLGAKTNYQIAIKFLLEEKLEDAKIYFNALYSKYPLYFNIDEINKELAKYDNNKMEKEDWRKIYKFLDSKPFGIDEDVRQLIRNKLK